MRVNHEHKVSCFDLKRKRTNLKPTAISNVNFDWKSETDSNTMTFLKQVICNFSDYGAVTRFLKMDKTEVTT